jgi:hypothetical protein
MNLGILGQFVNSVLGTSKPKPEVKSLQLAAAAAKKVGVWSSGSDAVTNSGV